ITHMFNGRTCSDTFADSLSLALDMAHYRDDGGSFTDTANLTDLVPECCNVSVGYQHEHSKNETLDMGYLEKLTHSVIRAFAGDGPALTIARVPGETDALPDNLEDMTDAEIYDLIEYGTADGIAAVMMDARDALLAAREW